MWWTERQWQGLPPSTSVFPVIVTPPTLHTHIRHNTLEEHAGLSWEISNIATFFRMSGKHWTEKHSGFFLSFFILFYFIFFVRVDYGLDYQKIET
jgi:hypothetical protein